MEDRHAVKEGHMVRYVHKFDADTTETPNISPAIVVKVKEGRIVNLFIMTSSGTFHAVNVPHCIKNTRGTWHRHQIGE